MLYLTFPYFHLSFILFYSESYIMAKPFVKWVGGKRQLMPSILSHLPGGALPWTGTYFEPFMGGGAVFFEMQQRGWIRQAKLNDFNEELVNLYLMVQKHPQALFQTLQDPCFANDAQSHQRVRAWDQDHAWPSSKTSLERAARFLFLNRTSFNGLWRVNKKNQFNVPFGRYKEPGYPSLEQLLEASVALKHVDFSQGDFEVLCQQAQAGDFVYFDPPYIPLSASSSFTAYTNQGSAADDLQARLARVCDELTQKGVKWMLSNSSAPASISLFGSCQNAHVHKVHASRSINSKAKGRGKIEEILVTNYSTHQMAQETESEHATKLTELVLP